MNKCIKPDNSWTLFLDRDGVINKKLENDYVKSPEQFEFLDGVPESIKLLSNIFGRIIIITNQQGIGKKLMSEQNLSDIHSCMLDIVNKAGGKIDKIYHCPDLDRTGSKNRKPEVGMGLKAKKAFPEINFKKSIMVGDTPQDMTFGKKLNMFTVFIAKDIDCFGNQSTKEWDWHFTSLKEFTQWINK